MAPGRALTSLRPHATVRAATALTVAVSASVAVLATFAPSADAAVTPPLTIAVSSSRHINNGTRTEYVANVGVSYAITYTLTNNSDSQLTNVGFTDQLPAGVELDDEVGETLHDCGNVVGNDNRPGQSYVSEAGLTVGGGASCTVTLNYVPTSVPTATASPAPGAPAAWPDKLTAWSYSDAGTTHGCPAATSTGDPQTTPCTDTQDLQFKPLSLTIAGPPTLSVDGVVNGADFAYGQGVTLTFSGSAAPGDAIPAGDLLASDEDGNTLRSGSTIDTVIPGTHQVVVWVAAQDGYVGSQTLSYTVASPSLSAVQGTSGGGVQFTVEYLANGTLTAQVLDGTTVLGTLTRNVRAGHSTTFTVRPTTAGRKLLAQAGQQGIQAELTVLYTASDYAYTAPQPLITQSGIALSAPASTHARRHSAKRVSCQALARAAHRRRARRSVHHAHAARAGRRARRDPRNGRDRREDREHAQSKRGRATAGCGGQTRHGRRARANASAHCCR